MGVKTPRRRAHAATASHQCHTTTLPVSHALLLKTNSQEVCRRYLPTACRGSMSGVLDFLWLMGITIKTRQHVRAAHHLPSHHTHTRHTLTPHSHHTHTRVLRHTHSVYKTFLLPPLLATLDQKQMVAGTEWLYRNPFAPFAPRNPFFFAFSLPALNNRMPMPHGIVTRPSYQGRTYSRVGILPRGDVVIRAR